MSTRTGRSAIGRRSAERLLRGGRGGDDRLASLLAAAKAPGRGGELAGEEMAVAEFRAARLASVPLAQRRSMIKAVMAKALTVKVIAIAATTAGVGGVALAASTGTIPSALHENRPSAASQHSPGAKAHPAGRPSDRPSKADVPSGMPPGLYWLCNDYIGRDDDHRGQALGEAKFRELVDKAGGPDRDKADKFCDKLLSDPPNGNQGARPTAHPTGPPTQTKKPDQAKPSQAAEPTKGRPSGQPSTHPTR